MDMMDIDVDMDSPLVIVEYPEEGLEAETPKLSTKEISTPSFAVGLEAEALKLSTKEISTPSFAVPIALFKLDSNGNHHHGDFDFAAAATKSRPIYAAHAAATGAPPPGTGPPPDDSKTCLICGDRATGLHYGIVSCEGCKGFFKRSVCNKRVYRCLRDKNCMMSRQKRNRCQYCRLLKCLQVGMNRKAIREDGMPGGRNKSIGPVKVLTIWS